MSERAHAKLTRSLRVVGRRDDGYHLLDAEMVSLELADEIAITAAAQDSLEVVDAVAWTGPAPAPLEVPTGPENLVRRALRLAGRHAAVSLVKRIPPGSGLGGGSSDAAAVLRWAGIEDPGAAARLGADVPFCLRGGRARVRGVGEVIEPLPFVDLEFLLCIPARAVSTAAVYAAFDELTTAPAEGANDLEGAALVVAPELARWRDAVAGATGRRPVLAGSGATWFVECRLGEGEALAKEVAGSLHERGLAAAVLHCRSVGARR